MEQFNSGKISQQDLKLIMHKNGVELFRWIALPKPLTLEIYRQWIDSDYHGEMDYLRRHLPIKENPRLLMDQAQSVLCVAIKYEPAPKPHHKLEQLNIASYARNFDYHDWLKSILERIIEDLREFFFDHEFLCFTDSGPVLERDLAYQAGLGWFGKNSCLINQKSGSYLLLGEIFSTVKEVGQQFPHPEMCGTCSRCIESCPTDAILENRTIDARKCISYWTIESKTIASENLRSKFGDHFFGCDICQSVCPWNAKILNPSNSEPTLDKNIKRIQMIKDLRFILKSSDEEIKQLLCNTPLVRAKSFGLKRNALIVIGNLGISELRDEVLALEDQFRLHDLVQWTLSKL